MNIIIKTLSLLVLLTLSLEASELPKTLKSWEGHFELTQEQELIKIKNMKPLKLRFYENKKTNGTVVAFTQGSKLMFLGKTNSKGIQPSFKNYQVGFIKETAQINILYEIQGQGGQRMIESYLYQDNTISLEGTSVYHGRHNQIWTKEKEAD